MYDSLDSLGFAASKLWNVARWTVDRIWKETGYIPDHSELSAYLKNHERYADLNAQSSQRVIQELAEAFRGWYSKRQNGDEMANPPGYRKRGDEHPRSTITFKEDGFKHDSEHNRVRLSKGRNLKDHWSDFILCEYDTDPDATVENVQQVRAVWNDQRGEWELHLVCRVEFEGIDSPGDRTAGIDIGISNTAAVSYGDEAVLYPGGALKEDEYYFAKERAKCDDTTSNEARRLDHKWSSRRTHFLHTLSKTIVEESERRGVGTIAVGDLTGIRENGSGETKDWGSKGNQSLHRWAFDRFVTMLEYKAEEHGIIVETVNERNTSKTCACCEHKDSNQRVERGLYICDECGTVANADVNGAENIRRKLEDTQVPPSPDDEDRSTGWMAQPAVHLFDRESGRFTPREQVVNCKP
ncbi:transposase, IS605 OrfB family protein [Natronococcus amylolyticus DSM 10524]|uniref:Transposase, IS605 OrfB family protein n=1 Tax=Natronococcus amylolyticus DSM 10524 TaxID=1227497 RepID=L9XBF9_9EURY|nr:transposase, IS605 OrfB family protein [Natronococcus amylolyticus DSM 10524]